MFFQPSHGLTFPHGYGIKLNRIKEYLMYIDPNTGGILFQALAGIFAALSGVMFFFSRNIREFFARLRRRARKEDDDQTS
jgi:hypothetical protein